MPYMLEKVRGGYYVKNILTGKRYSERPMPLARARKQLVALMMNARY